MEKEYDPTIRHFVALIGRPDYILVESDRVVKLFYVEDERTAIFTRLSTSPGSRISNANGFPASLVRQLSVADQARVEEGRRTPLSRAPSAD